jgi:hypothetical protein
VRICNKFKECVNAPTCEHAVPHEDLGCIDHVPCYAEPCKELSWCVEILEGKYPIRHRDHCTHCAGRGYTQRIEYKNVAM